MSIHSYFLVFIRNHRWRCRVFHILFLVLKEEEEEENKEEEDTQTIQELIAQLSSNPNKSEEEEAKIAGLVKAQNKMIELGVTTKQAIKLVPELWKF